MVECPFLHGVFCRYVIETGDDRDPSNSYPGDDGRLMCNIVVRGMLFCKSRPRSEQEKQRGVKKEQFDPTPPCGYARGTV